MLPTNPQLEDLRRLLLDYAFDPAARLQRAAVEYIFQRMMDEREKAVITPLNVIELRTPEEQQRLADNHNAAYRLILEIGAVFDVFYHGIQGRKPPHAKSAEAKFRPRFRNQGENRGNYALDFEEWQPPRADVDLFQRFWGPHLPPAGVARTLYPEPIFLRDEDETYFRNAKMGTSPDPNPPALNYLHLEGALKPGYSYVPSGIVRSLLILEKAFRRYNKHQEDFYSCEVLRPSTWRDTRDKDLIVLATPTTTDLVKTLQDGLAVTVDVHGVHFDGQVKQDSERERWGVCTRTLDNNRIVTMIAARHGRSIEGITGLLANKKTETLSVLARRFGRVDAFPETFQILFRMDATDTLEGPSLRKVIVDAVYVDGKRIDPSS